MFKRGKLILAAIHAGLLSSMLTACGTDNSSLHATEILPETGIEGEAGSAVELVALADDEAAAREIAALYQIELLSFSDGVAVYSTQKNPYELIALGNENGYPTLTINNTLTLY